MTTKAIEGSGRPRGRRSCSLSGVQEESGQQEYLLHVWLTHEPASDKKRRFSNIIPSSLLWLFSFLHFCIPFFPSLYLIFSSLKYVRGLVPNRHEVLIAATRGSQMLGIIDGFACSFPSSISILSPLSLSLPVNQLDLANSPV